MVKSISNIALPEIVKTELPSTITSPSATAESVNVQPPFPTTQMSPLAGGVQLEGGVAGGMYSSLFGEPTPMLESTPLVDKDSI